MLKYERGQYRKKDVLGHTSGLRGAVYDVRLPVVERWGLHPHTPRFFFI